MDLTTQDTTEEEESQTSGRVREILKEDEIDELLLRTPVSFLCPLHVRGCRDGHVLLFHDNTPLSSLRASR